jgi:outer membrane protein with beta-barrel domain
VTTRTTVALTLDRVLDASQIASSEAPDVNIRGRLRSGRSSAVRPHAIVAFGVALLALSVAAQAQVASERKGLLTLELGQGAAPVGGIAGQVAGSSTAASRDVRHAFAFRFMAGYQFAEQLSVEVGVGRIGAMNSSAPYAVGDTVTAAASLVIVEADLIGHIPLTPGTRVDLTIGATDTALLTSLSTQNGSALPAGQSSTDNVRRFGATAAIDLEWRLGDVTSLIVGYHVYARVGSPLLRDSASGTAKAILGGFKFEF